MGGRRTLHTAGQAHLRVTADARLTSGVQAERLVGSADGGCAPGRQVPWPHDSGPGSVRTAPAAAAGAAS